MFSIRRNNKGFLIVIFLVITILSSNTMRLTNAIWPTDDWITNNPIKQKMKNKLLNEMIEYIENYNENYDFSDIDSIVVIKNGYIIKEWYDYLWEADDIHVQWSVTKSFTCTLIGIAIKEGFIPNVNELVLDFFSDRTILNVDYRKEAITIEHLLLMSTGLDYPGDDEIWLGWMNADDQVQYILDLPMATEPGTIFNYDTGGSHLLSAIIQNATGMTTEDFAIQYLFNPLGINHFHWLYDKQGISFGGHGLFLTSRDMAKLGYLYLNDGYWEENQILPNNWMDYVTQTHWYLSGTFSYARQWWTHPNLNMFSAQGRYGQSIFVLPDEDIIVVFTADLSDVDPYPYLTIIENFVLPAIMNYNITLYLKIFIPIAFCFTVAFMVLIIRKRMKIKRI
ncbi:MAG: serine hydrolase [Asgard group archaeon]|nr:serine hydrolase [Asgard group archaeon]